MDDSLCAAALLRRASAVRFLGGCIYYQYSACGLLGWRALAARLLVGSLRRPCPGSCPGPAPDTDDCSVVDDIRLYQLLFSSPPASSGELRASLICRSFVHRGGEQILGLCTVGDGARGPSCPRYGVDDSTATFPGSSRSFPITDDQPCTIARTERSPAAPDVLDAFDHEARTLRYRTWTRPWVLLPLTVHSFARSRACAARWYLVFLYFLFCNTRGHRARSRGQLQDHANHQIKCANLFPGPRTVFFDPRFPIANSATIVAPCSLALLFS